MDLGAGKERERQMRTKKRVIDVQASSGNVFADLGVRKPNKMLAKAKLANRIYEIISARRLTQAQAAQIMGLDQPKISALVRGRLRGFSMERLFRCLNALTQEVRIVVRPAKQGRRRLDTDVLRQRQPFGGKEMAVPEAERHNAIGAAYSSVLEALSNAGLGDTDFLTVLDKLEEFIEASRKSIVKSQREDNCWPYQD
jgi:predicted XRE-type DNA-binding protein